MSFLNSIESKSKKFNDPFLHWELDKPLTEEQINEIVKADIANPLKHNLNYDGTRAIDGGAAEFRKGLSHGGKALKFRCFVNKENSNKFPQLTKFIRELQVNPSKQHSKLLKYQAKAEKCLSREEAQKLIKKAEKAQSKLSN